MKLGAALGTAMYHLMPWRRQVARTNIDLCFPQLNAAQRDEMVRACFRAAGRSLPETALCWWGGEKLLRPLCTIEGLEHLRGALRLGRGVILLSAHFTCLEIGGRLLALHHPFHVMYKKHRNALFETIMKRARENQFERAVERHDIRGMLKSLKDGKAIWYAPDQDFGPKHSVFAPFLGVNAATLTAPARLAKMSGAPVVPFFPQRLPGDRGYQLTILPALTDFPSGDEARDAQRINAIIERQVLKTPEQYLWLHRRFKTRPAGESSPYTPKRR